MTTITIIGKNSRIYKKLDLSSLKRNNVVLELSHSEVYETEFIENPIVFSFSKVLNENQLFLNEIIKKTKGKITLISSISSDAYRLTGFYNYPKIKYTSEETIKKTSDYFILKVAIIEEENKPLINYYGRTKITTLDHIATTLSQIDFSKVNQQIDETWKVEIIDNSFVFKFIFSIQLLLFKRSKFLFLLCRPMTLFFRIINYKNYGYTFISNNF